MKKRIAVVLLIIIALMMTSCGKSGDNAKKIIVGMATDTGGLGDKSFNDGCHNGLKDGAEKLGIEPRVVESKQQTDYIPNLTGLSEDGAKLVFAVGFLMETAILEVAKNNPNTNFAGIDIFIGDTAPKNALGILFKEQESGFIAGVLAGLLTKEYASCSDKLNDKNVVGMILGLDIPPVERYQAGFYPATRSGILRKCPVFYQASGR